MFTFNAEDALSYVTKVNDIRLQVLPEVETSLLELAGVNGALITNRKLKPRTIEVDITVQAFTLAKLRTKVETLAGWLYTDVPKPLAISDNPNKIFYAILDKTTDLEEIIYTGKGTLYFLCVDPLKYGSTGRTVNFTSTTASVSNLGTYWTPVKVTVNFNAARSNIKISLSSAIYVQITRNFISGDVLVIDGKTGKITLNGSTAMQTLHQLSNLSKFRAEKGASTFTLDSATGVSSAKVEFTERWL